MDGLSARNNAEVDRTGIERYISSADGFDGHDRGRCVLRMQYREKNGHDFRAVEPPRVHLNVEVAFFSRLKRLFGNRDGHAIA